MSTPLLPEVVREIDANPVSYYGRGVGQVWSLTYQSVPYVNFKVGVLEFAYKWRWLWLVWILNTWQWLSRPYTLQLYQYGLCGIMTYLLTYLSARLVCSSVWATAERPVSQECDIVDKPGLAYVLSWTAWSYREIYQFILLTVPVSSAGCERAFSKLCLVKDELRSTMGDERHNGLMLMAVEKNIVKNLDLQTYVDTFALKPQKNWNSRAD